MTIVGILLKRRNTGYQEDLLRDPCCVRERLPDKVTRGKMERMTNNSYDKSGRIKHIPEERVCFRALRGKG